LSRCCACRSPAVQPWLLAQEPIGAEDGGELGAQHLERDGAVVLKIARAIDRGHPAAAELTLDRVTAREGRPHAL